MTNVVLESRVRYWLSSLVSNSTTLIAYLTIMPFWCSSGGGFQNKRSVLESDAR